MYAANSKYVSTYFKYGDVFGFDSIPEVLIASSGLSLGHLNNVRNKNKR